MGVLALQAAVRPTEGRAAPNGENGQRHERHCIQAAAVRSTPQHTYTHRLTSAAQPHSQLHPFALTSLTRLCVLCGSLLHRFHHNLSVGDMTLRNFATAVKADIAAHFNVEAIRAQIKRTSTAATTQSSQPPTPNNNSASSSTTVVVQSEEERERDKQQHDLETWNEFKFAGFARTVSAIYAITLLHAIIKLQLSVVSRYVLVEQTKNSLASSSTPSLSSSSSSSDPSLTPLSQPVSLGGITSEVVNKCYFGVSEWAQKDGLRQLMAVVEEAVRAEMSGWELNAQCSREDVELMMVRIRQRVDVIITQRADAVDDSSSSTSAASLSSPDPSSSSSSSSSSFTAPLPVLSPAAPVSYASFLYPPTSTLESTLETFHPQLRDAAKQAVNTDPAAGGTTGTGSSALTVKASERLEDMVGETVALLQSRVFNDVVAASVASAMAVLAGGVVASFPAVGGGLGVRLPFASVMVKCIKLFDVLLPDDATTGGASALFDALAADERVRDMCAVIYLPMDEHGCNMLNATHAQPPAAPFGVGSGARNAAGAEIEVVEEEDVVVVSEERPNAEERKGEALFDR